MLNDLKNPLADPIRIELGLQVKKLEANVPATSNTQSWGCMIQQHTQNAMLHAAECCKQVRLLTNI